MTTNFVRGSYQEIIDLHTVADRVTVIGIHTPTGSAPKRMFKPFFDAYRQYHYDGCSLALVPAATLPADISQVSYEAGEPPIDARDILNPILWHGCHGENMNAILNQLLNGPATTLDSTVRRDVVGAGAEVSSMGFPQGDIMEVLYYQALTDKTWAKAHPMRGFRKGGLHPLVYDLATNSARPTGVATGGTSLSPQGLYDKNSPDGESYSSVSGGTMGINASGQMVARTIQGDVYDTFNGTTGITTISAGTSRNGMSFFTPRMRGLGWLDTKTRFMGTAPETTVESGGQSANIAAGYNLEFAQVENALLDNPLPLLYMGLCLLPPAYKASQHFRLILNHRFSWRGFRGKSLQGETPYWDDVNYHYFDPTANKSKEVPDDDSGDSEKE